MEHHQEEEKKEINVNTLYYLVGLVLRTVYRGSY